MKSLRIKFIRNFRMHCASLGSCALLLCLIASCTPAVRTQVDIKSLSLNPDRFIGARVKIAGKLTGVGPADSYLLVEDQTGRIMVGTEQIAQRISCPNASRVELVGTLRRLKNLPHPYFSMENLIHCGP